MQIHLRYRRDNRGFEIIFFMPFGCLSFLVHLAGGMYHLTHLSEMVKYPHVTNASIMDHNHTCPSMGFWQHSSLPATPPPPLPFSAHPAPAPALATYGSAFNDNLVTQGGDVRFDAAHQMVTLQPLAGGCSSSSSALAAFSLVLLSEIADKTFFTAAILAMRLGRGISFAGTTLALSLMALIGTGIGSVVSSVPDEFKCGLPVGELIGVALLLVFGLKALQDGNSSSSSSAESEMREAEHDVKHFTTRSNKRRSSCSSSRVAVGSIFQVASLIFLAEWGDKSMLTTVALGSAQEAWGVAVGATAGYAAAAALAVVCGSIVAKHVNERTISMVSGAMFLVTAAMSAASLL